MNDYDFKDRTAVVTGAAQGIGFSIARRLMQSGAAVAIWDRDPLEHDARTRLDAVGRYVDMCVDVRDSHQVEDATAATMESFGRIDVLVNSAGITGGNAPVWEYPLDDWERVQRINLDGTFHCCRAVVPHMLASAYGRIVNIASIAGKEGNAYGAAYSASKAAVIALTKSLGKELAGHDIAVNCITPVAASTKLLEQMTPEYIDMVRSKIPRGRFVTVDEIASMIAWLCSEENSFATAGVFDISGGRATY